MSKFRLGLSVCTYACLGIGVFSMLFSLLWIALGGTDHTMFQSAVLMMYLSIAGAVTTAIIDVGATATQATVSRVVSLVTSRRRHPV
jgi:hypothetical protein